MKLVWSLVSLVAMEPTAYGVPLEHANYAAPPEPGAGYVSQVYWPAALGSVETAKRKLASNDTAAFLYITYKNGETKVETIDQAFWQGGNADGGRRQDYLLKLYYANTRDLSNSRLRHTGCYQGSPDAIQAAFFSNDPRNNIRGVVTGSEFSVSTSSDGFMLGIEFDMTRTLERGRVDTSHYHFRIPSCVAAGKAPVAPGTDITAKLGGKAASERMPASAEPLPMRAPAAVEPEKGFVVEDKIRDEGSAAALPRFKLRADYDKAFDGSNDRPWRDMDISTEQGALDFAVLMQKHFYEGMANQNPRDPNKNFIPELNKDRYWCHMPWLNVGNAGREAIHGMTNERPLQPSPIYPNATEGSDWGIGFYNAVACRQLERVFGTAENPKAQPDWSQAVFPDGSVSVKILFTTADFPALNGAFTWKGNVSLAQSNSRAIRDVRHIQMDIAVKDSSLAGTQNGYRNWVMTTYYYDKDYQSPIRMTIPAGLKKMRPVGSQVGFTPNHSIIFAGSQTNQTGGRLNGPADNPRSSCLGCHATAGTRKAMAPGVMSHEEWEAIAADNLDYSQQVALAKKNVETRRRR